MDITRRKTNIKMKISQIHKMILSISLNQGDLNLQNLVLIKVLKSKKVQLIKVQ